MSEIRVSVIIPHYNGREILEECLESLDKSVYRDFETILVDNGSTDDSLDMVESKFPNVRIIRNAENLGFAGGCNSGIRRALGKYLLILNNDTIHDPQWIGKLADRLDREPETASVMPKILSYTRRDFFDYSGASGGFMDIAGYPFARGRLFDHIEKDEGQYDQPMKIFWASGTAFMVRKSVLDRSGLFDERFFAHMEEIDLHWRFHLMGYNAAVEPAAVIYHHSGWTLPPDSFKKKYLNHRNNLIMVLANYRFASLLAVFPLRLLLEWASAFYALARGDAQRFAAVFAGQLWILMHPAYIIHKHLRHRKLRSVRDRDVRKAMYPRLITADVYLKGIRRWSDLFGKH